MEDLDLTQTFPVPHGFRLFVESLEGVLWGFVGSLDADHVTLWSPTYYSGLEAILWGWRVSRNPNANSTQDAPGA